VPLFATRNNGPDFLEAVPDKFFEFVHSFGARHQNDFVDGRRSLKRVNRVNENRLVTQQSQQFVEPHPLAAARGDDDDA
jgi:hypothetical protein